MRVKGIRLPELNDKEHPDPYLRESVTSRLFILYKTEVKTFYKERSIS